MREQLENLIYNNKLFCALIFIPFVEPLYFTQLILIDTIFFYWKMMAIAIIIVAWSLRGRIDKVMFCLILFLGLDCIVTTLNSGNTTQMYINAITLIAMAIMFMSAAEAGSYKFISVVSTVLEILIVINLITILLFPDGLYNFTSVNHHYLLGSRNVMMRTIFPGVCFSILRSKIVCNRLSLRTVFTIAVAGGSLVLVWSATALFAFTLFTVLLVIHEFGNKMKWLTVKLCYVIAIVIFFVIVVFQMQNLFSFVIVNILQKDTTFTGRTVLWDAAMLNITQSPILGYGLEEKSVIAAKLYRYTEYDSCHNLFLDLLYQNGVVGFALICVLFSSVARKVDNYLTDKYRVLFTLFVFGYALMVNFEPFINGDLRLLVSMLVFMNYFDETAVEDNAINVRRVQFKFGSININ